MLGTTEDIGGEDSRKDQEARDGQSWVAPAESSGWMIGQKGRNRGGWCMEYVEEAAKVARWPAWART